MLKTKNLDFSWVSSDVKVISHVDTLFKVKSISFIFDYSADAGIA
jgi:hypothetical protein